MEMAVTRDQREELILVDEDDRQIATGAKLDTHREGALHRAFSVFLFRPDGALLLQRRAAVKYHSRGLWANTCCGHPRPGEPLAEAAARRLDEELGITAPLRYGFPARYRAELDNGMVENEIAHLFFAAAHVQPRPDPDEADAVDWVGLDSLIDLARSHPGRYAAWLRHYLAHHSGDIRQHRDALTGTRV